MWGRCGRVEVLEREGDARRTQVRQMSLLPEVLAAGLRCAGGDVYEGRHLAGKIAETLHYWHHGTILLSTAPKHRLHVAFAAEFP